LIAGTDKIVLAEDRLSLLFWLEVSGVLYIQLRLNLNQIYQSLANNTFLPISLTTLTAYPACEHPTSAMPRCTAQSQGIDLQIQQIADKSLKG
jgi:hypothetical protein